MNLLPNFKGRLLALLANCILACFMTSWVKGAGKLERFSLTKKIHDTLMNLLPNFKGRLLALLANWIKTKK